MSGTQTRGKIIAKPVWISVISLALASCNVSEGSLNLPLDASHLGATSSTSEQLPVSISTLPATISPTGTTNVSPINPVEEVLQTLRPTFWVNTGDSSLPECIWENESEIWKLTYPYQEPEILLSSDEFHYFFPKVSNQGNWVAFVQSQIGEAIDGEVKDSGSDTIWIMKQDGSEQRQISPIFPRYDWWNGQNCAMGPRISEVGFSWSLDDNYLFFNYFGIGRQSYLINIQTGLSVLISSEKAIEPIWIDDTSIIMATSDSIEKINFADFPDIERIPINWPFDPTERKIEWPGIHIGSGNILFHSNVSELWILNTSSLSWQNISIIDDQLYWPRLGRNSIIMCNSSSSIPFVILDKERFSTMGRILLQGDSPNVTCNYLDFLNLGDLESLLITANIDGQIYIAPIQPGDNSLYQIMDISQMGEGRKYLIFFDSSTP